MDRFEYKTALNTGTATSALELRILTVVGAAWRTNAGINKLGLVFKEMPGVIISRVHNFDLEAFTGIRG